MYEPTPNSLKVVEEAKAAGKGYVCDCLIQPRNGDTVFDATDGDVRATLLGYAIIPIEEYERLQHGQPQTRERGADR